MLVIFVNAQQVFIKEGFCFGLKIQKPVVQFVQRGLGQLHNVLQCNYAFMGLCTDKIENHKAGDRRKVSFPLYPFQSEDFPFYASRLQHAATCKKFCLDSPVKKRAQAAKMMTGHYIKIKGEK